jgi:hypothetical protein
MASDRLSGARRESAAPKRDVNRPLSQAAAGFTWRATTPADVPDVHRLMRELAIYEKIEHEFLVTEAELQTALFSERPYGEALLAEVDGKPVGVCLWYKTFSSFAGRQDIWIEDIYVDPGLSRPRHRTRCLLPARAARAGGWLHRPCRGTCSTGTRSPSSAYRAMGAVGREEWTDQRVSGQALVALAGKG